MLLQETETHSKWRVNIRDERSVSSNWSGNELNAEKEGKRKKTRNARAKRIIQLTGKGKPGTKMFNTSFVTRSASDITCRFIYAYFHLSVSSLLRAERGQHKKYFPLRLLDLNEWWHLCLVKHWYGLLTSQNRLPFSASPSVPSIGEQAPHKNRMERLSCAPIFKMWIASLFHIANFLPPGERTTRTSNERMEFCS